MEKNVSKVLGNACNVSVKSSGEGRAVAHTVDSLSVATAHSLTTHYIPVMYYNSSRTHSHTLTATHILLSPFVVACVVHCIIIVVVEIIC
jgi:hypothetical protein